LASLAHRLLALGHGALFERRPAASVALWAEAGMPGALAALVADPGAPDLARFLAAELIATHGGARPDAPAPLLAAAYAAGLAAARTGNAWGLPGEAATPLARRVIGLGAAAAAALRPLLGDPRPLEFAGSEDATLGEAAGWRVRDAAAMLVAAIEGRDFDAMATPAARDAAIAAMC
jgi:hypothetical protein